MNRASASECRGSSMMKTISSLKTVTASSKPTPCFAALVAAPPLHAPVRRQWLATPRVASGAECPGFGDLRHALLGHAVKRRPCCPVLR